MEPIRAYLERTADPLGSIVLVLPLFVLYNLGLLATGWSGLNGADLVTVTALEHLGLGGYVGLQAALLVGFVVAAWLLTRRGRFEVRDYLPMLAESALYAALLGTVILMILEETVLLGPSSGPPSLVARLTLAAGAGVHEEVILRAGRILGGATALHRWGGLGIGTATVAGVVGSSVLFSLAHYVGPEAFAWFTFAYRALAGLAFALLFLLRGFAVAVYTHCLYDVYVMVLSP